MPKADQIRELLFPSVLATTVDDRGIRFLGREALPFACLKADVAVKSDFDVENALPARKEVQNRAERTDQIRWCLTVDE
jgi:hypothetical protein